MLEQELQVATEAVLAAGAEVARFRRDGVRYGHKDGYELVSEADLRASEMLYQSLMSAFPDSGWLGEEHTDTAERQAHERVWVVDPIDGTREYLQGIPEYAISVGLVIRGEPALGVVYNPAREELYAAVCLGSAERPPGRVPARFEVLVGRGEKRWDELPPLPPGARSRGIGSVAYRLALLSGRHRKCSSDRLRPRRMGCGRRGCTLSRSRASRDRHPWRAACLQQTRPRSARAARGRARPSMLR